MNAPKSSDPPQPWSVYVHFPFCRHRCAYCDFATVAAQVIPRKAYTEAIISELELRTVDLAPAPIKTVFFGGGTPSLWGAQHIAKVLGWLDDWGTLQPDAEITVEANPGATDHDALTALADVGVTRLSVGVQAFDDQRLHRLDRIHDADSARATLRHVSALLDAGKLQSASADLILGGPGQDLDALHTDVDTLVGFGLPHLSIYALTVEVGTPLSEQINRGLATPPDEGVQAQMLAALPDWLARADLHRYEVSNFAVVGHESRHNMSCWMGDPYLAVGVGAHGFVPKSGHIGRRYGNHRSFHKWRAALAESRPPEAFEEQIDAAMHADERLLTGLRLSRGVDVSSWRQWAGQARIDRLLRAARQMQADDKPIVVDNEVIRTCGKGLLVLDGLVLQLSEAMHGA